MGSFILKLLKYLGVCVLLLRCGLTFSQDKSLVFNKLNSESGLTSNQIRYIFQDSKGFVWVGTDDGLNRYDGQRITTFQKQDLTYDGLRTNWTDGIAEDQEGNLYVGTEKGLSYFNYKTEQFEKPELEGGIPDEVRYQNIFYLLTDSKGNIWISVYSEGVYQYNIQSKKFIHYYNDDNSERPITSNFIIKIFEDSKGGIWLISDTTIDYLSADSESFEFLYEGSGLRGIAEDKEGNFFTPEYTGDILKVAAADIFTKGFQKVEMPDIVKNQEVQVGYQSIYIDRDDRMWLGLENIGLLSIETDLTDPIIYKHDKSNANSISSNSITFMMEDTSGDLWIGTQWSGINIIHYSNQAFKSYELSHPITFQIVEDVDKKLWVCTDGGGVCRFDPELGKYHIFSKENSGLGANEVTAAHVTRTGDLIVGCWNGGINVFDRKTEQFSTYDDKNTELNSTKVFDFAEDSSGMIWAAMYGAGVSRFDPVTGSGNSILTNTQDDGIFIEQVEVAFDGRLFFGGYTGVYVYDVEQDSIRLYEYQYDQNSLSNNFIYCLFQESDSILWAGTRFGLNRLNLTTGRFQNFFMSDGLPSNVVKAIVKDDEGYLWLSTNLGISRFDYDNRSFRNYTIEDGLQGRQFSRNSGIKTSDGTIYFGGTNGFTAFNPAVIQTFSYKPKLVFTDFRVLNQKVVADSDSLLTKHISNTDHIKLKHWQSFFSLSFSSLNFITSEKTKYRYKLEGFDKDWVTTNESTANYTNVDPGTYVFTVLAAYDNVWDEVGKSIEITILPPWWQTTFFRISIIALFIFAIITYNRKKHSALLRKQLELEQEVSKRTEKLEVALQNLKTTQDRLIESEKLATTNTLIAGMAHELNNPLNFIQGGKELIETELKKLKESDINQEAVASYLTAIDEGISRAQRVVEGLEYFSVNPYRKIEPCNITRILDETVNEVKSSSEYNLKFEREIEEELPSINGNREELYQLFSNILRNAVDAIKESGVIQVMARSVKSGLQVVIKDNGVGMEEEVLRNVMDPFFTTKGPGKGIGLGVSLAYKIVKNHNGEIKFQSQIDQGTKVQISFPLGSAIQD